jgi:hypothetical protein
MWPLGLRDLIKRDYLTIERAALKAALYSMQCVLPAGDGLRRHL